MNYENILTMHSEFGIKNDLSSICFFLMENTKLNVYELECLLVMIDNYITNSKNRNEFLMIFKCNYIMKLIKSINCQVKSHILCQLIESYF